MKPVDVALDNNKSTDISPTAISNVAPSLLGSQNDDEISEEWSVEVDWNEEGKSSNEQTAETKSPELATEVQAPDLAIVDLSQKQQAELSVTETIKSEEPTKDNIVTTESTPEQIAAALASIEARRQRRIEDNSFKLFCVLYFLGILFLLRRFDSSNNTLTQPKKLADHPTPSPILASAEIYSKPTLCKDNGWTTRPPVGSPVEGPSVARLTPKPIVHSQPTPSTSSTTTNPSNTATEEKLRENLKACLNELLPLKIQYRLY